MPDFTTVNEYIQQFDEEVQERMNIIRTLILDSNEQITEKISWGMPTFVLNGNLVHFAGHKKHIGFYPAPSAIESFQSQLTNYHCSKGAVQFPFNQPMPYELIQEMVNFRIQEQLTKKK